MSEFFSTIHGALSNGLISSISVIDILDIIIITFVIYQILKFFKNTKAMHVLKGIAILIVALAIASWMGLPTTTWLLSSVFTSGIVVIVVLFQPELRRVFETLGRGKFGSTDNSHDLEATINEIVNVADRLSKRHVGALMVFEQKSNLDDIVSTGTFLNAKVSAALIENVFEPNTPLHDGAMVIKGSEIVSAGCFLPLSENNSIEKTLGTRHRAALGMSERSDAIIIVISEETGVISSTHNGNLQRYLDLDALRALLNDAYAIYGETHKSTALFLKLFGKENGNDKK